MSDLDDQVLQAVEQVLGRPDVPIPLHEPEFRGEEWTYLKDCLDTGWVSSVGAYVDRIERDLATLCGVGHAVAAVNGTAALHVCLRLAGVEAGDAVLVPSLTFVATVNAIAYQGATPLFVDSEDQTLGVDPEALEAWLQSSAELRDGVCIHRQTGAPIRALMAVHVFGHPCRIDDLKALADRWNLVLIEDAAEALGSTWRGRPLGGHGRLAALSFNGNKIVTTGGGGAVLTDDPELARLAKHLTTTAKVPHAWNFVHDAVGWNYRMPNLNAALGCAQLERLPDMIARKRALHDRYRDAFADVPGVRLLTDREGASSNAWLNALVLEHPDTALRNQLLQRLNAAGYGARPLWTLIHRLPMYAACPRAPLPVAERLEASVINLPSSARLAD